MSLTAPSDVEGYRSAGPVDAPRLVRQRRVHRGWVGLGLLAIVIAALGSVTLFRALGPATSTSPSPETCRSAPR